MLQHLQHLQLCIREDALVQIQVTECDADKIFLFCRTNMSYMVTIIPLCLHVLCDHRVEQTCWVTELNLCYEEETMP